MKTFKWVIMILLASIIITATVLFVVFTKNKYDTNKIDSFDKCAAKYPIMKSYPAKCQTPDGKLFIESINDNASVRK